MYQSLQFKPYYTLVSSKPSSPFFLSNYNLILQSYNFWSKIFENVCLVFKIFSIFNNFLLNKIVHVLFFFKLNKYKKNLFFYFYLILVKFFRKKKDLTHLNLVLIIFYKYLFSFFEKKMLFLLSNLFSFNFDFFKKINYFRLLLLKTSESIFFSYSFISKVLMNDWRFFLCTSFLPFKSKFFLDKSKLKGSNVFSGLEKNLFLKQDKKYFKKLGFFWSSCNSEKFIMSTCLKKKLLFSDSASDNTSL